MVRLIKMSNNNLCKHKISLYQSRISEEYLKEISKKIFQNRKLI